MSTTWKKFGNLEYADFVFNADNTKVFVVYDNIANRFFFSISDLYTANGHSTKNATRAVVSETYKKHYRPIYFNMFPDHVFISMSNLSSFLQRYFACNGISTKMKDSFKKKAIFLTQSITSAHKNGKKVKEKNYAFYCLSSFFVGDNSVSFTYIDGKMALHVRDMVEAMGYSRTSGLSDPLMESSESYRVFGNPSRYILVSKLPYFATKSTSRTAVMEIYRIASDVARNMSSRYENKLVVNKDKTVAFYNNEHAINTISLDGDVAYRVSDVSKAIGLKEGSKGLRNFSVEVDNVYYATSNNIRQFIEESTMTRSIKGQWNDFLNVAS